MPAQFRRDLGLDPEPGGEAGPALMQQHAESPHRAITQPPGIPDERSLQGNADAIVADAVMDLMGLSQLEICPWALREGVILKRLDSLADPSTRP